MLALVLVGALIAQSAVGKPTNCGDLCDNQSQTKSYGSYSKSSYNQRYSSGGSHGTIGSGLGATGANLENFDDSVIGVGTTGLDRPGNWRDEKHYITDDGRGEMSYRAGQTVTDHGYSKFAQHSYSYGTHDSHAPQSNSQILSLAEFNRELQNMRSRISSFMGTFNLGTDSTINANLLQDFKQKASVITSQLNNVCNQVDNNSSMYQQMQRVIEQFQRDVEQKQREMEAIILQTSSHTSTVTHGSIYQYPSRPSPPAPIQQQPTESSIIQQQLQGQVTMVQNLINTFYANFGHPSANLQYQQDFNAQVDSITQKLTNLSIECIQHESTRVIVEHLKTQFEAYVAEVRSHIREIEQRNREEEEKRKQRELQLQIEKQRHDEEIRRLEAERIRIKQEEAEKLRLLSIEQERIRLKKLDEERIRQQKVEEENLRHKQEHEARLRAIAIEQERLRVQQLEDERLRLAKIEQDRIRFQKETEETLRRQREEEERLRQQQQLQKLQQPTPQVTGTVKVTGTSTYQHTIQGSYGTQGSTTGSYGSDGQATYNPQSQHTAIQPHVDLTAAMSRLQQDLNRLQNEVNNFNMYSMRLTSSNSATIVSEAERQAESLRQSINNLCETSNRYHNVNIQTSAEELARHFEELFRTFQNQAANYSSQINTGSSSGFSTSGRYSSGSSYGTSGSYGTVHAPTIGNVEIEHTKTTDVEIGRIPASQRYSSGSSYGSSSGYSSHSSYGSKVGDQVECAEQYAGQPCITRPSRQSLRYRRQAGEQYGPFYDLTHQMPEFVQQHQPIFDDLAKHGRNVELGPYVPHLEGYRQQQIDPLFAPPPPFGPYFGKFAIPRTGYNWDFSQRSGPVELPREYQPVRNQNFTLQLEEPSRPQSRNLQQGHRIEDLTRQEGTTDDYYARQNPRDQVNRPVTSESLDWQQKTEDSSQQHINFGGNDELEDLQKPRNENVDVVQHSREPIRPPTFRNLEIGQNSEHFRGQQTGFEISQYGKPVGSENPQLTKPVVTFGRSTTPSKLEEETGKPQRVLPITTFEKLGSAQESEHFTLEKSGFNDYPQKNKKPELIEKAQDFTPLIDFGESQTEEPQRTQPITFGISRVDHKPQRVPVVITGKDFTLEKSGFNDYPEHNGKAGTTENSHRIQSVAFGKQESRQESDIFTLQQSGFDDYPSQNRKPESNDKTEDVQSQESDNLQLNQQTEELNQQQSTLEHSFSRNEKIEKPERYSSRDLTQQTADQIDFGPESQLGRQHSSGISKPERFGLLPYESQQKPATPPTQNFEYGHRSEHPTGQYIDNLSQQHQVPPHNIQTLDSNRPNQELERASSETERIFTTAKYEVPISTLRPVGKPAPKPIPRYTRPWQLSQLHNLRKQYENEEKEVENKNASVGHLVTVGTQNSNHQIDVDKHSESLRGDLPGISELSTTEPSVIEEEIPNNNDNQEPISDYESRQQNEQQDLQQNDQHDLQQNNQFYNLQKSRNDWLQNNSGDSQFDQSGRSYINQQSIRRNYEYSHQSNYYRQHSSGIQLGDQIQEPLNQEKSNVQYNQQSKPIEYNQKQESIYQFHEHQAGNLEIEHQESTQHNLKPRQFDKQSELLEFDGDKEFSQQSQEPLFVQHSGLLEFDEQQQNPSSPLEQEPNKFNDFGEGVVPLDGTRPIDSWTETDSSTTPRTFWKRIGHKLSNTFDKAKEKARTIFG